MTRTVRSRWMLLLAAGLLTAAGGCSENPVTGDSELTLISRQQEIAMGTEASPQFETEFGGAVPDSTLQGYVQSVGMQVARVSHRPDMPYEYTLVRSDVPNAFALPGGKIFVTAGLVRRMTNERQLAAVLGHETGHVAAKHNVKGMQRQMGVSVLAEIAARATGVGTAGDVAKIVGSVANLKYSRDDEYQADRIGIEYLAKANYNPWGMVELLTILLNLHEEEPGTLAEMFQTHPLSSKRIEQASETIREGYPSASSTAPDPAADRFAGMKARMLKYVE